MVFPLITDFGSVLTGFLLASAASSFFFINSHLGFSPPWVLINAYPPFSFFSLKRDGNVTFFKGFFHGKFLPFFLRGVLISPCVPYDHNTCPILSFGDNPFKISVIKRMVFSLQSKAFLAWVS